MHAQGADGFSFYRVFYLMSKVSFNGECTCKMLKNSTRRLNSLLLPDQCRALSRHILPQ